MICLIGISLVLLFSMFITTNENEILSTLPPKKKVWDHPCLTYRIESTKGKDAGYKIDAPNEQSCYVLCGYQQLLCRFGAYWSETAKECFYAKSDLKEHHISYSFYELDCKANETGKTASKVTFSHSNCQYEGWENAGAYGGRLVMTKADSAEECMELCLRDSPCLSGISYQMHLCFFNADSHQIVYQNYGTYLVPNCQGSLITASKDEHQELVPNREELQKGHFRKEMTIGEWLIIICACSLVLVIVIFYAYAKYYRH